jgi:hypothetical protein
MRSDASADRTRRLLAIGMVLAGMALLTAMAFVALVVPQNDDSRLETTRFVFAAVVPLIGTWIGTVLAFYFTSDNLKAAADAQRAATESTATLMGTLAPSMPVRAAMKTFDEIDPREVVKDDGAAQKLVLDDLWKKLRPERGRIPIFDESHVPLYVVHDEDISRYAALDNNRKVGELGASHTLAELLADATLQRAVKAFTAIGPEASLGDARAKMSTDKEMKDLFVTADGTVSTKALGWITTTDLARIS